MDELDWDALTCSGVFKDGLCQLLIHDIQFMKHQGNWSCQVKLESNGSYVNATGSPLQLMVLAPDWKDWMMSHMNRYTYFKNKKSQFDQRGSYTMFPRRSYKFHQLCILSGTIQWCYPKY